MRDWIHGVRAAIPEKETRQVLENDPLYEAERLRIIYQLITNDPEEGGAGITPKNGDWKNVESIFALHDHVYNKRWIKHWSREWFLKPEDLDDIRNRLGEKVRPKLVQLQRRLLIFMTDCLLLCFHPVLLCLFNIPSHFWALSMVASRTLLANLCHC